MRNRFALAVGLMVLVTLLAWVRREPSVETDGRDTGPRVPRVIFDSVEFQVKPVTIDLKINNQDHDLLIKGHEPLIFKWKGSGAKSCALASPKRIEFGKKFSGVSEKIMPGDKMYPNHLHETRMFIFECSQGQIVKRDTILVMRTG